MKSKEIQQLNIKMHHISAPGSRHSIVLERVVTLRNSGGFLNTPTPGGVPVRIRSPGLSVMNLREKGDNHEHQITYWINWHPINRVNILFLKLHKDFDDNIHVRYTSTRLVLLAGYLHLNCSCFPIFIRETREIAWPPYTVNGFDLLPSIGMPYQIFVL